MTLIINYITWFHEVRKKTLNLPILNNKDMYTSQTEKQWVIASHLGTLLGFVVPFGNIIVPLVIWISKKEESKTIEDQARESLNFQITITIFAIIAGILILIVIGIFLLLAILVFQVAFVIIATIEVDKGNLYRYPLNIRLIT